MKKLDSRLRGNDGYLCARLCHNPQEWQKFIRINVVPQTKPAKRHSRAGGNPVRFAVKKTKISGLSRRYASRNDKSEGHTRMDGTKPKKEDYPTLNQTSLYPNCKKANSSRFFISSR